MPYQWSDDPDEPTPVGAIVISIASIEFERTSDAWSETVANVYWADWITGGDRLKAELRGPHEVPAAIEQSLVFKQLWGFERVVIVLQDRSLWRAEWGELMPFPGFDEE